MYGPIFLALGVAALVWAVAQRVRARRSVSWPTVRGVIRATTAEDERVLGVTYPHQRRVRYVYEVANRLYTGGRVYFGDDLVPPRGLIGESDAFREGREITIHYNPQNPDDAVLDTRVHPRLSAMFRAGVVLLLLGPIFFWVERHPEILRGGNLDYFVVMGVGLAIVALTAGR